MLNYMCVKCQLRDIVANNDCLDRQELYHQLISYLVELNERYLIEEKETVYSYFKMHSFNHHLIDKIKIMNKVMNIEHEKIHSLSEMAYQIYRIFLIDEKIEMLNGCHLSKEKVRNEIEKMFDIGI